MTQTSPDFPVFCPNCGAQNEPHTALCRACRHPLYPLARSWRKNLSLIILIILVLITSGGYYLYHHQNELKKYLNWQKSVSPAQSLDKDWIILSPLPAQYDYLTGQLNKYESEYSNTHDKKYLLTLIDLLARARRSSPNDPRLPDIQEHMYADLARDEKDLSQKSEYFRSALQAADDTIRLSPGEAKGYLTKGSLLQNMDRQADARQTYQYILDHIDPHNEAAMALLDSLQILPSGPAR